MTIKMGSGIIFARPQAIKGKTPVPIKKARPLKTNSFSSWLKLKELPKHPAQIFIPNPIIGLGSKEKISAELLPTLNEQVVEDLNHLIKKIARSFNEKKTKALLLIDGGLFDQTRFLLTISQKDLLIEIHQASSSAQNTLLSHQKILKDRLAKHEINLMSFRFIHYSG